MACKSLGPYEVNLVVDDDGYRTYTIRFKVRGEPGQDGPYQALNAEGLPPTGVTWGAFSYRVFELDIDPCCWCRTSASVDKHPDTKEGENPEFWIVTKTFSNRPQRDGGDRCPATGNCHPTEEPQKISIKYSEDKQEASYDRFGKRILSSSHEPIHGPNNEWVITRTTVTIEQNVIDPQFSLIEQMKDSLNDRELWGLPPRTIRFKPEGMTRHFRMTDPTMGTSVGDCECYFTRTLSFEIHYKRRDGVGSEGSTGTGTAIELTPVPGGPYETWDRDVWDEGTKVLRGYWSNAQGQTGTGSSHRTHWTLTNIGGSPPDPDNPQHFIRFKDWNGENARTLLDGEGRPAFTTIISYQYWVLRVYNIATDQATVSRLYLPCASALKTAQNADDENVAVNLYGPFTADEADAAMEDDDLLVTPVTSCPDTTTSVGVIHIEKYGSSDFRLLGIPEDFTIPLPPYTNP